MKIFINALSARQGGGQTYLKNLLDRYPENQNKLFIIAPDSLDIPPRSNIEKIKIPQIIVTNPFIRSAWEFFILPTLLKFLKVNVLFCPGGSISGRVPKSCKIVTTFQNMMPFDHEQRKKYPLGYMRLRNWLLERKLLQSMMDSDLVIFISNFAKSVIRERSKNRIKKSVMIPHGINPLFKKVDNQTLGLPAGLPRDLYDEGYLLYVSILDVYKSQIEVVEAYALLKKRRPQTPKLIFIGPEYVPYGKKVRETISKLGLESDILLKTAIPNADLPALYQNATLNIFASQTENCPFILLEALASGAPLLVSSSQPMPEFSGEAVMYFNPNDPKDLAQKLQIALDDAGLRSELGKKALIQSHKFNWEESAQKTWQAIESLV